MLTWFRGELYQCLTRRADALLELADAVLCRPERVHMLAELSLEPECRRGHGAVYDAVKLRGSPVRAAAPRAGGRAASGLGRRRIRLAADVSNWLRPDAETSPERLFCHCYARGKGNAQMIPGWSYSFVAALEPGRTSWTLPLDAVRLSPADDATAVTAAQIRDVVMRITGAGHWHDGDPDILIVFDSGYDLSRLAWLLRDLPVEVAGRLRSDRVMHFPAPPRPARPAGTGGRRPGTVRCSARRPEDLARPSSGHGDRDGPLRYRHGDGLGAAHQPLATRAGWEHHHGELPFIEAPSSGSPSVTCPATAAPNRCGCVPPAPGPPPPESTAPGRRSCAASISNTIQAPETGSRLDPPEAA